MLSILISAIVSVVFVFISVAAHARTGTAVFIGIISFIAAQYVTGFLVRRSVKKVQNELQELMMRGQQRINRKIQQFQTKPGGNIKLIQRQIEGDQKVLIQQALDFTQKLEPFKKWSPLMGRQIATMHLQFHYQLKDFEKVDELLAAKGLFSGPMLMEALPVAMKMARQYKNGDVAGAEKTFKRRVKWFRGSRATLLYGLMSWILVKQGESEKARQLLLKGKEATGDETLAHNWTLLSNENEKKFSNAGLGDEWFGLYLENPPMPKQKRVREKGNNARRF